MTEQRKYKRRIKLIKPRLQLRMIATFVGLSALGFLLQALLVAMLLSQTAAEMPEGGDDSVARIFFDVDRWNATVMVGASCSG